VKYINFPYPNTDKQTESYEHLRLPYGGKKDSSKRILFVLDYVPSEDLHSGALLSGDTGTLLFAMLKMAQTKWLKEDEQFAWMACNWNAYRTSGKSDDYKKDARERFGNRLTLIIKKYKPTCIITFGKDPSRFLSKVDVTTYQGLPLKLTIGELKVRHVSTISLNSLMTQPAASWLIGYVSRHLSNAISHKVEWAIAKPSHEAILVNSVKKFDKMLAEMYAAPVVSIDTETTNLNKVQNSLLTFQACTGLTHGYLVPIHHKDSPFDTAQRNNIKNKLKEYFETNDNKWQVYANAVFDLNVMRSKKNLDVRYYKSRIHDIFGGEFGNDENAKFWSSYGRYYYSLANLSLQFGTNIYERSKFGKGDRATIKDRDLDQHIIEYGVNDVCIPFAIREVQLKIAHHQKNKAYLRTMAQISDTIHTISEMESNGSGVDINYLFGLRLPDSPIKKSIADIKGKLYNSKGVAEAEARLRKKMNLPTNGLFGKGQPVFDFGKSQHKQLLYFDVLKLKPLSTGPLGGKLDKKFQEEYANVEEVKLYTNYSKALKLESSFVKSFLKQYRTKPDFQKDGRIRPSYDYLKVITGRLSSNDPSLHQIPSRSELGKNIKRLFKARPGFLYAKVDYRSHEVRGWGNMSGDKLIAGVFNQGDALINKFKLKPTAALAKQISLEADVHKINASYFFDIPISEVTKEIRQDVKQIIFGLIYGMSIHSLAVQLDKPEKYIKDLVAKFFSRFPVGAKWFPNIEAFARTNLFVESPLGLRRNLYAYMIPINPKNKGLHGAMDRRARNSPVQGLSSQLGMTGARLLAKNVYQNGLELHINNSVHDSLENEVAYKDFFPGIKYIEYSLTDGSSKVTEKRHGWKMLSTPQIDFDFGPTLANCEGWDFDIKTLVPILRKSIEFQKTDLSYDVNVERSMKEIFSKFDQGPKWLHTQISTTDSKWISQQADYIQKALKPYR
jgi:DNA polymerase I-like protein with 3'-5' exonuclease and polymerase domains